MTQVKVCCISSPKEAKMAIDAGANIIGLVGPMPSGPGIITNDQIATIAQSVPTHIDTWLLTSETSAFKIISHHRLVKTKSIQIVDKLKEGTYRKIKEALPGIKLIQVLHVIDKFTVEEANNIADQIDYLLLDSGDPNAIIKTLGGTGNVHNWDISRQIVESVNIPVFLAGGLNSDNIYSAIQKVKPYGVDLCSGVRTDKKLDIVKLKSFVENMQNATP